MTLITNNNYTLQKISIKTDRLELRLFFSELVISYKFINLVNTNSNEFIKRELLSIMNKLHLKLNNPNTKKIEKFTFNYYEVIALQEIAHFTRLEAHFFDVVFWKIDSKFRKRETFF